MASDSSGPRSPDEEPTVRVGAPIDDEATELISSAELRLKLINLTAPSAEPAPQVRATPAPRAAGSPVRLRLTPVGPGTRPETDPDGEPLQSAPMPTTTRVERALARARLQSEPDAPLEHEVVPEISLPAPVMPWVIDTAHPLDLDPDTATEETKIPALETPWRQLHPASLVVNLIPRTWRVIASFWPFLLAIAFGRQGFEPQAFDAFYVLLLIGSGAASTAVHYFTLRYRLHRGRLEVKQGLLNREARVIDPARIQNVERVENVFHKLAGLVEVRIETAGDARTEGLLSALGVAEARALMHELDVLRGHTGPDEEAREEAAPVVKLGPLELIAHGLTSTRAGLASLLFFGGMEVMTIIDPESSQQLANTLGTTELVALGLIAVCLSWVISTGISLTRHHRYLLFQEGERLRSEQGLLTRRRVDIPLAKVQLARMDEPLLRRWMGFGSLSVETAALGPVTEGPPAPELEVPMVERERLGELLRLPFPVDEPDPWSARLERPHRRALYRAVMAAMLRWVPVAIAGGLIGG